MAFGNPAIFHPSKSVRLLCARCWLGTASICLLALLACPPRAGAQVSAAIEGDVTDPSGGVISAAMVSAKDVETELVRSTTTDGAGRYELLVLPVGAYEVTVAKD